MIRLFLRTPMTLNKLLRLFLIIKAYLLGGIQKDNDRLASTVRLSGNERMRPLRKESSALYLSPQLL
jgi:hypothetical protein